MNASVVNVSQRFDENKYKMYAQLNGNESFDVRIQNATHFQKAHSANS